MNAPESPANSYILDIEVKSDSIDQNGHVNNVVYVQWMQELAIAHWSALGGDAINREHAATWVARSHHIEYLRPAHLGDQIFATTWVDSVGKVRSMRKYAFVRKTDGQLLARGETDWVFVRVADGRPHAIPLKVHALLEAGHPPESP